MSRGGRDGRGGGATDTAYDWLDARSEEEADDELAESPVTVPASGSASVRNLKVAPLAANERHGGTTIGQVLDDWLHDGPLVHEPTGIPALDELTGGGPVYGTRWYLAGAPDAGKTALLVQIVHAALLRGVAVGLLAVDEDPDDIVTRFAQRRGHSRKNCEIRDPAVVAQMRETLGKLPLRIYDATWTIEAAAAELAAFAKARADEDPESHPRGPRAMLAIDSLQTVRCAVDVQAEEARRELPEVSAVTARARAIRSVATKFRLIAIATSEQGRGSYRSNDPGQQTSALASAKWSGAVEYSARVLVALRPVPGQPDLVELEIAKNKHGPRDRKFHLKIDRASQTLIPVAFDSPEVARPDRDLLAKGAVAIDAAKVARVLERHPGIGVRDLRGAVKAAWGFGQGRVDAARALLGSAVNEGSGARNAKPLSLKPELVPPEVRRAMEGLK
ncbi:MAG: DnaB-like helicase C-terminal domain-containing protein [Myxococcales bacterium]